ncbi:hypothetical protein ACFPRL_30715 [Pseudoclavibacter helvolus]
MGGEQRLQAARLPTAVGLPVGGGVSTPPGRLHGRVGGVERVEHRREERSGIPERYRPDGQVERLRTVRIGGRLRGVRGLAELGAVARAHVGELIEEAFGRGEVGDPAVEVDVGRLDGVGDLRADVRVAVVRASRRHVARVVQVVAEVDVLTVRDGEHGRGERRELCAERVVDRVVLRERFAELLECSDVGTCRVGEVRDDVAAVVEPVAFRLRGLVRLGCIGTVFDGEQWHGGSGQVGDRGFGCRDVPAACREVRHLGRRL